MDRAEILGALRHLAAALEARGLAGDMFVVGGAAMAMAFDARRSTRDIDAVFVPKREIYESAAAVGEALGLRLLITYPAPGLRLLITYPASARPPRPTASSASVTAA